MRRRDRAVYEKKASCRIEKNADTQLVSNFDVFETLEQFRVGGVAKRGKCEREPLRFRIPSVTGPPSNRKSETFLRYKQAGVDNRK